jgi:hypothetical protein
MVFSVTYCPTRRALEERSWKLVSRLSKTAGRLLGSAGVDHRAFNATTLECREIRALIVESHEVLRAHRLSHGC